MRIAQQIASKGFATLPVPPLFLSSQLKLVRTGMKVMTESPTKLLFPWRELKADCYGEKYRQEIGLVKREDKERKYVFQYMPSIWKDLSAESLRIAAGPEIESMFAALGSLSAMAHNIAWSCADSMDREYANTGMYRGSLASRIAGGTVVTRVLRYLPNNGDISDAFTHIDRGLFAVHWGATHTGLFMYLPSGERVRVDETTCTSVIVFPGRKMAAAAHGKLGFGTPHGVKYDRVVDEDRYSYVSFVHPEPLEDDAKWLLENDARIKEYEHSFPL